MPRNASGTYSLPAGNPVVTATTITSSWANTTLDDLKTEMTDSLDRSGKGGMLAALALVDGTAALPALAFNSESTTGAYRPAANELGLAVAGAQQLRLRTAAPALLVTSPLAAADVGTDFVLNTTNARTAGDLFAIQTGAVARLRMNFAGTIALGNSGVISADTANLGLQLVGNKAAADAGSDVILDSVAVRTAGNLLAVRNSGTDKLRVLSTGTVDLFGNVNLRAGTTPVILATNADTGIEVRGNKNAASVGPELVVNSTATRTAGNLLLVLNNGASQFNVDFNGNVVARGSYINDSASFSLRASGTNAFVQAIGNKAAADTGTDVILNTTATRTAGALVQVQNNGSYRAQVGPTAVLQLAVAGTTDFTIDPSAGLVRVDTSNTSLVLKGNRSAADAGADVVVNGQATRTAGNLLDIQNNATSKARFDFNGNLTCGTVNGIAIDATTWSKASVASRVTITNASPQDITGLSIPCATGKTIVVRGILYFRPTMGGTSTVTLVWTVNTVTVSNPFWSVAFLRAAFDGNFTGAGLTTSLASAGAGNAIMGVFVQASFETSGTAGSVQLQGNRTASGVDSLVVQAGSFLEYVAT